MDESSTKLREYLALRLDIARAREALDVKWECADFIAYLGVPVPSLHSNDSCPSHDDWFLFRECADSMCVSWYKCKSDVVVVIRKLDRRRRKH